MAKKSDEKDVLIVRDEKTGEISVVAGLMRTARPSGLRQGWTTQRIFYCSTSIGDMLDNFFKKLLPAMQGTQPLRFLPHSGGSGGFAPGSEKDLLQHPYQNKDILARTGGHIPLSDAGGRREKREERGTG